MRKEDQKSDLSKVNELAEPKFRLFWKVLYFFQGTTIPADSANI